MNTSEAVNTSETVNSSEVVNTSISKHQSVLEQLVDNGLPQEDTSRTAEEPGDIFHAADTIKSSQMGESGHVLTVKITDNIRIPAFSELEILAQVKGDGSHCYMLDNN